METIKVRWTGTRPLLVHSEILADPTSPQSRRLKEITSQRGAVKSTDTYAAECSRAEWEGGLYYDPTLGPYMPGANILASIEGGARLTKMGKEIERGLVVLDDMVPIEYTGPRDLDGMYEAGMYDRRGVKVGQAKIQRTRPIFHKWTLNFQIAIDPNRLQADVLRAILEDAGRYVGIGTYRKRFGRFNSEVL